MRDDIIQIIQEDVRAKCESPNNFFGPGIYYHIKSVVKNAALLAEKYGGDAEVVTIAAWLHDYASITDYSYYKEHHIHGAEMAGQLLRAMQYPTQKIELVQECILHHRGSAVCDKTTVEEICVADADAISHFDSIPSLFYLTYAKYEMSIQEGIDFVREKLRRSYDKLSDDSKLLYRGKFRFVIELLSDQTDF